MIYKWRLALRISLFLSKSAFRCSTDSFKALINSSFCSGMRHVLKKSMNLLIKIFSGTTCSSGFLSIVLFDERCRYTNFSYSSPDLLFALYNRSYTKKNSRILNHILWNKFWLTIPLNWLGLIFSDLNIPIKAIHTSMICSCVGCRLNSITTKSTAFLSRIFFDFRERNLFRLSSANIDWHSFVFRYFSKRYNYMF